MTKKKGPQAFVNDLRKNLQALGRVSKDIRNATKVADVVPGVSAARVGLVSKVSTPIKMLKEEMNKAYAKVDPFMETGKRVTDQLGVNNIIYETYNSTKRNSRGIIRDTENILKPWK